MRFEKYSKLKGRMAELGVTQIELANILNKSISTINAKLNGIREFTIGESITICNYLEIENPKEFFYAENIPNTQR